MRGTVLSVLVLAMVAALAAACGGGAEPTATPTTQVTGPTPTQVVVAVTPTPSPKYGGTFNVVVYNDPPSLDGPMEVSYLPGSLMGLDFNRLVNAFSPGTLKPGEPDRTGDMVPDLAKSWDTPDPLTYIFHLNEGVKWQNLPPVNGREVTSADVVYSINRTLTGPGAWLLASMAKVEAVDRYTVKFTLKQPDGDFLGSLGYGNVIITPREAVEQFGDLKKVESHIGSGPFILDRYDRNIVISYRKNPDYFETGIPYVNRLDVNIIADRAAAYAAFRAGQLDVWTVSSADQRDELKARYPEIRWDAQVSTGDLCLMYMNTSKPPYDNVKVRKAVSLALDRYAIGAAMFRGQDPHVKGPIPRGWDMYGAFTEKELAPYYKQDVAQAKQLLQEAGYASGWSDNIQFYTGYGPCVEIGATLIKEQLAAIKVNIELKPVEYAVYATGIHRDHKYTLTFGPHSGYATPGLLLQSMWKSNSVRNITEFYNDDLDNWINQYVAESDAAKRKAILADIQTLILENMPTINIANYVTDTAIWPYVHQYKATGVSNNDYHFYKYVWLSK